jgi:hypothetical protein
MDHAHREQFHPFDTSTRTWNGNLMGQKKKIGMPNMTCSENYSKNHENAPALLRDVNVVSTFFVFSKSFLATLFLNVNLKKENIASDGAAIFESIENEIKGKERGHKKSEWWDLSNKKCFKPARPQVYEHIRCDFSDEQYPVQKCL